MNDESSESVAATCVSVNICPIELIRFWQNVDKSDPDKCWPWTSGKFSNGYGRLYFQGSDVGTHRISWLIHNGPIPHGLWVLHKCDNHPCCNPDHLFLGTRIENISDMVSKGRQNKGEKNGGCKINEFDVGVIRSRYASGETCAAISKDYPISTGTVWKIIKRKKWAYYPANCQTSP